jgi:hypothetical protein
LEFRFVQNPQITLGVEEGLHLFSSATAVIPLPIFHSLPYGHLSGFNPARQLAEIKFEHRGLVQLLPQNIRHENRPSWMF